MAEEEEMRQGGSSSKGGGKAQDEPEEMPRSSKAQEKPAAEDVKTVPLYKLFAFADSLDVLLMLVGTIGAVGNGLALPLMTVIFGQLTNAFGNNANNRNEVLEEVSDVALKFVYLGCGSAVAALLEVTCWMCTGERQAARIRSLYLKAILRQDVTFFDKETSTGEVIERMSGDTILIQDAMGEKAGKFIQLTTTFVGGFIVAFIKGWKLTLVLLAVVPMIALAGGIMAMLVAKMASKGQTAYAEAGTVVEQAIGSIRTVASFTGEKKAVDDYDRALNKAYKAGVSQGVVAGCGLGFLMFSIFASYSLGLWFGSKLILHEGYSGGSVINVIFAVLMGGMSLGQTSPSVSAFAAGKAAAYKMFEVIHRTPEIDVFDKSGLTPDHIKGDIELRNVNFTYPARPDVPVFSNFCLTIPSGITAALVGESGSGKSTVISLIERFYDPQGGEVLLDGVDIRKYQLRWLRQQIGLVSQEPVLFGTSIRENISYGRDGATEEEIKEAARLANALKFITKMPQGFETHVGDHGTQLSGGQKQRVAIARAILKNPTILLLDEATSALDTESERLVQQALDHIMQNRTTVVVAHRLSTIKNAHSISVVQRGNIVETGTHSELLQRPDGAYAQLVRLQEVHQEKLDKALAMAYTDPDDITAPVSDNNALSRNGSKSRSSFGSRRISRTSFSLGRSLSLKASVQDVEEGAGGDEMPPSKSSFFRLAALNKPETPILLLGLFGSVGHGVLFPVFGLLLSSMIGTFFETDRHKLRTDSNFWSSMFLVIAVSCIFFMPIQMGSFALAGQRLIRRVRRMSFDAIVRQEIAWFDAAENSSGAISSRLSTDAAHVRSMVGDSLSMMIQNIATIAAGLIIAFTANWILALIILALVPLLSIQGFVQTRLMLGFSKDAKVMYEEATKIANNAVSSIRTVASYCMEQKMLQLYERKCSSPLKSGVRTGVISGLGLGFSNFVLYGTYALSFWFGARLVKEEKTTFKNVFRVFFAISMSALGVSQTVSFAPDFVKVKKATSSIFTILDRKSKIDSRDTSGQKLDSIKGDIEFRQVSFRYPSRPGVRIFRDLSFAIEAGKTMALVGESGSGKSTVIALLERFYDPEAGQIFLDGVDIKQLQLKWLRQSMGLVSQEPILFSGTVRSNIAYGKEQGKVTEQEIEEAVAAANATRFIAALPNGYDTEVGERGIQLSGGQKQRIAIARAVVKDPRILLLDEATSALDAESERVVQEALDRVMVGRTTVVVAHRLSTIVNVDVIAVVKNGAIVEQGSHSQLIGIPGGAYASLVKLHRSVPAK